MKRIPWDKGDVLKVHPFYCPQRSWKPFDEAQNRDAQISTWLRCLTFDHVSWSQSLMRVCILSPSGSIVASYAESSKLPRSWTFIESPDFLTVAALRC